MKASVSQLAKAPPRQRRRSGEVHTLILDAARQTFAEKGYARATTRDIAARAAVAETLLFRKFESKAKLFAEAALQPLAQFIRDFAVEMAEILPLADPDATQRRVLEGLYKTASSQRGLLLTLFATSVFEPEVVQGGGGAPAGPEALGGSAPGAARADAAPGLRHRGLGAGA